MIDDWRSSRTRPEIITDDLPEPRRVGELDTIAQHAVDRDLVVSALRTLSPEHREVIVECYFRGSSVAEAAAALDIPPGTVKSRTHYALRALRLAIDEMGGRS